MEVYSMIKIAGVDIFRPKDMVVEKTTIIQAEYTTCTGKVCGDVVGTKYSDDMELSWDYLTDDMVRKLSGMVGKETTMEFTDATGTRQTAEILISGFKGTPTRVTRPDGTAVFTDLACSVRMIGAAK